MKKILLLVATLAAGYLGGKAINGLTAGKGGVGNGFKNRANSVTKNLGGDGAGVRGGYTESGGAGHGLTGGEGGGGVKNGLTGGGSGSHG